MRMSQVLATLNAEGLDVKPWNLRYLIDAGKIERPPLDRSLNFHFTDEHVEKLRELLTQPTELASA